MKQIISIFSLSIFVFSTSLIYQNCSKLKAMGSANETATLMAANPFKYNYGYDVNSHVDQIYSDYDAIPHNPYALANDIESTLADCSDPKRYELEKDQAIKEAKQDTSGLTVPVQFAYSFGFKVDVIAKYAHMRAILSEDNPGESYIPVGPRNASNYKGSNFYYKADHTQVKQQILRGEKCFFGTIKIKAGSGKASAGHYDFINLPEGDANSNKHKVHYMYYGWCALADCAGQDNKYAGEFSNRLFQEVPSLESDGTPQIIKLYVADIREGQMANDSTIIKIPENTTRGLEINKSIYDILDVCAISRNVDNITTHLEQPLAGDGGTTFGAIDGANQVLNNLLVTDFQGTILATQYTPIVLDLGTKGIRTSSVRWGTYFNMAALRNKDLADTDPLKMYVPHRTAWLGGIYRPVDGTTDIRIENEDGFLVLPDANGKVLSSAQMFGDNMPVNGKYYNNGFLALRAYADKNCISDKLKDKYLGPWDGDLYNNKIKVWIDKNRNGVVDANELKGLKELGVAAVNTCNIVHSEVNDKFGNGTALRAAFLMEAPGEDITTNEKEILNRIQTGKTSAGTDADFRLSIDIIFKVNESLMCKPMQTTKIVKPVTESAFVSSAVVKKK